MNQPRKSLKGLYERVRKHTFVIPDIEGIPQRGWGMHSNGYVFYNSRRKSPTVKPRIRLHKLVIEILCVEGGQQVNPDWVVHHMDFNKKHNCPSNLLYCPKEFNNTVGIKQDPYTGRIMSREAWWKLYGTDEPNWVTNEF